MSDGRVDYDFFLINLKPNNPAQNRAIEPGSGTAIIVDVIVGVIGGVGGVTTNALQGS